jgi:hypothetical protein
MRRNRLLILLVVAPLLAGCAGVHHPRPLPAVGATDQTRSTVSRNLEEALVAWVATDPEVRNLSDDAFEALLRRQALLIEGTDLTPDQAAALFDRLRQVRRGAIAHSPGGRSGPS